MQYQEMKKPDLPDLIHKGWRSIVHTIEIVLLMGFGDGMRWNITLCMSGSLILMLETAFDASVYGESDIHTNNHYTLYTTQQ